MSTPTSTRQWILASKPTSKPIFSGPSATFKLETKTLPSIEEGQVLLRTLYFSNDPAQRGWIDKNVDPERLYAPPVQEGDPMRAYGLCEVIESKAPKLSKGTKVVAWPNWSEYAVVDGSACNPVQEIPGMPITAFLGALGSTGLTAYYGLVDIVRAAKEDTVVVSGAAGAAGSMVVQIAKHIVGCKRVIGIAGSDEKCKWVESLGADKCINYKKDSFKQDLIDATPDYASVYFDNVGGGILDFMLTRMARFGRIAACGAIAAYNDPNMPGLKNWYNVISMRIEIKGFIIFDYLPRMGEGMKALQEAYKEGNLKIDEQNEHVVSVGFEEIPNVWWKLFEGENRGKLLTKLV